MSNDVLFESSEEYKGFTITFQALIEDTPPEESFDTDVFADHIRAIHNGEVMYFCAKVTASFNGLELAQDYLGCCDYENYEDFTAEPSDYYADMRETVVEAAMAQMEEICEKFHALKQLNTKEL
jgi:hypothetical protein